MKRSRDSSLDDHASTTSCKRGKDSPISIKEARNFTDQIVPNASSVEASRRTDLGDDSYLRPDACDSHFFTKETIENCFLQGSTKPARPHQVSAVHRLLGELRERVGGGTQVNFLLQHSTGSGKSLTIACLVHHLRCLSYNAEVGKPARCFGAVIVLNDRIQLDRQLTDTITSFLQRTSPGVDLRHVDTSEELQSALSQLPDASSSAPAPVLLSTLQKFPSLRRRQASASRGAGGSLAASTAFPRICIVADEAHRSHGKGGTSQLHEALGGQSDQPDFLTYIAFTATPSPQALRLFGTKRLLPALDDGRGESMNAETLAGLRSATLEAKEAEVPTQGADMETVFEAWDSYSMKQALDDGHVLNVLEDYVTLCPRVEIDSNNNPSRPTPRKVAVEVLLEMAAQHRAVVDKKAEYIAQHLVAALERWLEGGFNSARGMLVARSRRHVLWFTQAIRHELQKSGHGTAIKVYGAYSGAVNVAGNEGIDCGDSESPEKDGTDVSCDEDTRSFTEVELNSGQCTLAEAKLLVVCNKFETGFDDPSLALMYVDKPLQGARAVQTLSRLNRVAPHLRKTGTSVVDFVNSAGSIAESFEEYFHATQLRENGGPAERRQRELHLDRLLTRLLTALTTATAKHGSSRASADEGKVMEAESSPKVSLAAVLESTPIELAAQVRLMLPEFQQAVEDDVVTYCAECERLQREKPELPFRFARALREALGSTAGTGRRRSTGEQGHGTENAEALVGVQVQSLEQTWSGEIVVGHWMVPLRSRKISQFSMSGGGGGGKSQKSSGRGGGMQLQQAIRAANEQLKEGYSKLAVEGLKVMKARLEAALWPAAAEDAKVPSLGGRDAALSSRCSEDPGAAVAVLQRLQMWDLRTELLSESGIAYSVNRCKKHAHPMVASWAATLVKRWKHMVQAECADRDRKRKHVVDEMRSEQNRNAPSKNTKENEMRVKVKQILQEGLRGTGFEAASEKVRAYSNEYIDATVEKLELAVLAKCNGEVGKRYKQALQKLRFNLRESWRVDGGRLPLRILSGDVPPEQLVHLDTKELATEGVRKSFEEAAQKKARKDKEELLSSQGQLVEGVVCGKCKCERIGLRTMTNGGTYAQERELIQKAECLRCGHIWRI